jgi:hypothetical protein
MTSHRPFRHKKRRYHHHPAALGQVADTNDQSEAAREGMRRTGIVLCVLATPFALAFVIALVLGPVNTRRWLSNINTEWLVPWLK